MEMEVRFGLLTRQRWRLGLDYWPDRDGEMKVRFGLLTRQRWRDEVRSGLLARQRWRDEVRSGLLARQRWRLGLDCWPDRWRDGG